MIPQRNISMISNKLVSAGGRRIPEAVIERDAKLALRQRVVAGMEQAIAVKEDRLRRLWTARLAHHMNELPPFDDVFREVRGGSAKQD